MFEKFTEKAINVVSESQHQALEIKSKYVTTECLLLALIKEAKGISLKIFKTYDIDFDKVKSEVLKILMPDSTILRPLTTNTTDILHEYMPYSPD